MKQPRTPTYGEKLKKSDSTYMYSCLWKLQTTTHKSNIICKGAIFRSF